MTVTMRALTKEQGGHPEPRLSNTSTLPPTQSHTPQPRPSPSRAHARRPRLQFGNVGKYTPSLRSGRLSTRGRGDLPLCTRRGKGDTSSRGRAQRRATALRELPGLGRRRAGGRGDPPSARGRGSASGARARGTPSSRGWRARVREHGAHIPSSSPAPRAARAAGSATLPLAQLWGEREGGRAGLPGAMPPGGEAARPAWGPPPPHAVRGRRSPRPGPSRRAGQGRRPRPAGRGARRGGGGGGRPGALPEAVYQLPA